MKVDRSIPWVAMTLVGTIMSCAPDADRVVPSPDPPAAVDGMVRVPAGRVFMGTDSAEIEEVMAQVGLTRPGPLLPEVPPRAVQVDAFYLDTIEVTNRAFAAFVAARPEWSRDRIPERYHNDRYLEHWGVDGPPADRLDHPVTFVTWWAGVAFCDWQAKRLPTEAEWEWGARGGDEQAIFPWGTALPDSTHANWSGNGVNTTTPAASYPPNGYGVYDMAGNVWEFLADRWYGPYRDTPSTPPTLWPDTADRVRTRRVVRGGSWGASVANLRIRYRDSHRPFDAGDHVGFRCARSASP